MSVKKHNLYQCGIEMNPKPNRQEYTRRTSYIITKYTVKEGTYRDVIKNIGAGGLFVRTSRRISMAQSIVLEFPLFEFEKIVQVAGTVIRRDADGFAVAFDEPLSDLICKDGNFPDIVHESDRSS